MALVKLDTIAKVLNLTPRRVNQLVAEGLPKAERGMYDALSCMQWYIRYLQKAVQQRASGNEDGTDTSWRDEKKRLVRLQANNEELDYRKKLGELVPMEMLRATMATFASTAHDRFLSIPSKIAPRLEGESREVIRVKLQEHVAEVLNGLSADPMGEAEDVESKETRTCIGNRKTPAAKRKTTGRTDAKKSGTVDSPKSRTVVRRRT